MNTITYKLGDLNNGDFASYDTEQEAKDAMNGAVDEGTLQNIELIGVATCWQSEDGARAAAEEFYYVRKHTIKYDDDGDIESEDYEILS
jgi:hypothetical protein